MRLIPKWEASLRVDGSFSPLRNWPDRMLCAIVCCNRACRVPLCCGCRIKLSTGIAMPYHTGSIADGKLALYSFAEIIKLRLYTILLIVYFFRFTARNVILSIGLAYFARLNCDCCTFLLIILKCQNYRLSSCLSWCITYRLCRHMYQPQGSSASYACVQ